MYVPTLNYKKIKWCAPWKGTISRSVRIWEKVPLGHFHQIQKWTENNFLSRVFMVVFKIVQVGPKWMRSMKGDHKSQCTYLRKGPPWPVPQIQKWAENNFFSLNFKQIWSCSKLAKWDLMGCAPWKWTISRSVRIWEKVPLGSSIKFRNEQKIIFCRKF